MSNKIATDTLTLFKKFKNPYNDPIKRAAHDVAVTDAMSGVLEKINKAGKDVIKAEYKDLSPGYASAILAEKGIAVNIRINNGANRFDSKLLPAELVRRGWKGKDGKPVSMQDIADLIEACTKQSAASTTITSTVVDE